MNNDNSAGGLGASGRSKYKVKEPPLAGSSF